MWSTSTRISRRDFLKMSVQGALALLGTAGLSGVYAYGIEPHWMEIKQLNIALAKLPSSFNQFRIVHFSDLHLGFYSNLAHLSELVEQVRELKPDLICFTGDLVDRSIAYMPEAVSILSQLRAPYGQYAVLGNHDAFGNRSAVTRGLSQAGFRVLHNEHIVIQKGMDKLHIAGVDDPWVGKPDIRAALLHIPEDACTILLAHEPDFADEYSRFPVALQLSGHSHGGQIRLPFFGALYTPPHGSKYTAGLYQVPNSLLQVYTTRGIGMTRFPLRFNCRPELTVMTLQTESIE
ncbi:metallophosphoesterase [Paenibacillus alba]|uniref:metallophosphoesterase n=1 Tax=Paenibacillus alba TaxID=1197127 RepID=UPI0015644C51|nr:metallophosphoesterase [Paenibacillus alba]NQX69981.1 metallophosphoesterase [Paenibacillus alba]